MTGNQSEALVQVVRNAARHLSEGTQLLGLPEGLLPVLGFLLGTDVTRNRGNKLDRSVRLSVRDDHLREGNLIAFPVEERRLPGPGSVSNGGRQRFVHQALPCPDGLAVADLEFRYLVVVIQP